MYLEERHMLRTKVGSTRMTLSGLLGDKDVVNATLEYIRNTGRFNKDRERKQGGNQMDMEGQFGQTRERWRTT